MFEILEHTADIGFRACGRNVAELFEQSAAALTAIAVETGGIEPREDYRLEAAAPDVEALLVNWLSEVLYWIDGKRVVFGRFRVSDITPNRVTGVGVGESRDPARHPGRLIVKGITYHQLRIAETPDGWCAEVYLDV